MKILVDGLNLSLRHGTGIATYARNFVKETAALGHSIDLLLGGDQQSGPPTENLGEMLERAVPFAQSKPFPGRRWIGVVKTALRPTPQLFPVSSGTEEMPVDCAWHVREVFSNASAGFRWLGRLTSLTIPGVDIAHWTAPVPLRVRGAFNIYTIHDLVPLKYPDLVVGNQERFRRLCSAIATTADHIVTVSESSRRDIVDMLGVSPEKVTNTYQTLEPAFWGQANEFPPTFDELGLPDRGYFLVFGAIEPKKNVARIVKAHNTADISMPLVIVGAPGWRSEYDLATIREYCNRPGPRCLMIEYLPRHALMGLIRGARATVFPSLYEGFGLPALESMALGTPVIGSTTGSLPEIIGESGIVVDPLNVVAIRDAMIALERQDVLWQRLSQRGVKQAEQFGPISYRRRISGVLERLSNRARLPEMET